MPGPKPWSPVMPRTDQRKGQGVVRDIGAQCGAQVWSLSETRKRAKLSICGQELVKVLQAGLQAFSREEASQAFRRVREQAQFEAQWDSWIKAQGNSPVPERCPQGQKSATVQKTAVGKKTVRFGKTLCVFPEAGEQESG